MERMTLAICTYNNAALLERTLATVEQQQAPPAAWSVLVVDNNSTDGTSEVVDHYIGRGRIPGLRRVVETRQGLAHARRRAVTETSTEWLAFIDDDCLLTPTWIPEAIAFCDKYPRAAAVGGRVRLAWEAPPDEVIARHATSYAAQDYGDHPQPVTAERAPTHLVGAGIVLRRQALVDCGWLERMTLVGRRGKTLTAGEDTEMVFRIRNAGLEIWYNPAMELDHFITRDRMSVPYLCRLRRGFGQARPATRAMCFNRKPTLRYRLTVLVQHVTMFTKLMKSVIFDHLLPGKDMSSDQRIGFYFRLGTLEGALRFALRGYR